MRAAGKAACCILRRWITLLFRILNCLLWYPANLFPLFLHFQELTELQHENVVALLDCKVRKSNILQREAIAADLRKRRRRNSLCV